MLLTHFSMDTPKKGNRQTVQAQIRRRRISTVCKMYTFFPRISKSHSHMLKIEMRLFQYIVLGSLLYQPSTTATHPP